MQCCSSCPPTKKKESIHLISIHPSIKKLSLSLFLGIHLLIFCSSFSCFTFMVAVGSNLEYKRGRFNCPGGALSTLCPFALSPNPHTAPPNPPAGAKTHGALKKVPNLEVRAWRIATVTKPCFFLL